MTQGTMELIQTVTVTGATQAAIEFTNIPQTYDDLVIKLSIRGDRASVDTEAYIQFNNNTSNYSHRVLFGTGSTAGSANAASYAPVLLNAANSTGSTFSSAEVYIPNYRGSTNKSLSSDSVSETNATGAYQYLVAGLWSNSAAITSIKFTPSTNSFVQHSTATLYGITRVPAGAKATGGVIYDDNQYWYHIFTSSGVFTPLQNITADYLVVAGGGGGGCEYVAGGGGGGGYLTSNGLSLTSSTNYTVTIGAGGSGSNVSSGPARRGGSGSNSVFGSITATGGGGGGANTNSAGEFNGLSGGSGGGAGNGGAAGTASPSGQGFAGGEDNFNGSNAGGGGGGGGAGAVGGDGSIASARGGLGGNGLSNSLSGTSVTYAGGGGGGGIGTGLATGGTGGGGNGGNNNLAPVAGTANTGGGGGGGGGAATQADRNGQPGGSGIVIVRYAK